VSRRRALASGIGVRIALAAGVGGGVWLDRQLRPSVVPAYRRLTFRRGVIRSVRVAPDGQTILYGALWRTTAPRAHRIAWTARNRIRVDLPDATVLAISRSGESP
jgi:hypothetical protein